MSKQLQLLTATNSTTKTQPLQTQFSPKFKLGSSQSRNFLWKFLPKTKIHRTQLSLKSSMGFRKLHSGFLEFTKIHPVRTIPLAFKCSIPESLLMHSCIQTSQFRLIHKNASSVSQLIKRNFYVLQTCPHSSPSFKSMYKYPWSLQNRSEKNTISQPPRISLQGIVHTPVNY